MPFSALGAGESGKSTISKQMKIIHLNGFSEAELLGYKPILQSNAIETIKILVNACDELAVPIEGPNAALAEKFENVSSVESSLTPEMAGELKKLWNDEAIQTVFQRRSEFQLPDSAKYVMDNIDRISANGFVPSQEDGEFCSVACLFSCGRCLKTLSSAPVPCSYDGYPRNRI